MMPVFAGVVFKTLNSFLFRLSLLYGQLSDHFSQKRQLHHSRFAKKPEYADTLTSVLDGEHLLLGVGDYGHILRVKPTKTRKELGNTLIVGRTRCGKGLLANSQIPTWPQSLIVNDIKGDLYNKTAKYKSGNSKVRVFDPTGFGD